MDEEIRRLRLQAARRTAGFILMPAQLYLVEKKEPVCSVKEYVRLKLQNFDLRQKERDRRRKGGKNRRAAAAPPPSEQLGLEFPDVSAERHAG